MIPLFLIAAVTAPDSGTKANAAREAGRFDDAVRLYRQAVAAAPRWAEGWWYLGTIYYDRNQYPACRDTFRRFVTLDAKAAPGFAMLGLCEFQTREVTPARLHLEKAMSLGLPAGQQLTQVAQYHLMALQTKAGNFERALQIAALLAQTSEGQTPDVIAVTGIAALRRAIFPQELPAEDRELAFKMGRALLLVAERRARDAKTLFEEIVATYPTVPNVQYVYGLFLLASEPDRGVEELEKELKLQPDHLPALVSLSAELLKRRDAAAALPYAERAVRLAPNNFAARATLGRILVELNRVDAGIRELQYAVKLAPESAQVHFSLASAYAKAGMTAEAARERAEFARLRQSSP
jgi:tetratricopeptide (TPR) repeat protein